VFLGGVSIVLKNMGRGENYDSTSAAPYTEKQPVICSERVDDLLDQAPDGAYGSTACSTPPSTAVREELCSCNNTLQAEQRVSWSRSLGVDDRHQRDSVEVGSPCYVQTKKPRMYLPPIATVSNLDLAFILVDMI